LKLQLPVLLLPPIPPEECCSAFANFSDDYVLTFTGTLTPPPPSIFLPPCPGPPFPGCVPVSGESFTSWAFVPCLSSGVPMSREVIQASASFGGDSLPIGAGLQTTGCPGTPSGAGITLPPIPFTLGVLQTFTVQLYAEADAGNIDAALTGFAFPYLPAQPDLHFTLVSVEVPEPSVVSLLISGLLLLVLKRSTAASLSKPR
jgi:hypothetical protein